MFFTITKRYMGREKTEQHFSNAALFSFGSVCSVLSALPCIQSILTVPSMPIRVE
jgi:hypothetical protein